MFLLILLKEPSREKALLTLHVMTEMRFYFGNPKKISCMLMSDVCEELNFLLNNIYIRFGTNLYRQVVGIPMGIIVHPWLLIYSCYVMRGGLMMSLSDDKQADIIDAFNTSSRYLDNILNINNFYSANMVSQTYQSPNIVKLIPVIPKPHF